MKEPLISTHLKDSIAPTCYTWASGSDSDMRTNHETNFKADTNFLNLQLVKHEGKQNEPSHNHTFKVVQGSVLFVKYFTSQQWILDASKTYLSYNKVKFVTQSRHLSPNAK